jgi:hypothetical protein
VVELAVAPVAPTQTAQLLSDLGLRFNLLALTTIILNIIKLFGEGLESNPKE